MYIQHGRALLLVLFAVSCPLSSDGYKTLSYSVPERHPIDEILYDLPIIDNHRTMLDQLDAIGALPDTSEMPQRLLRRPREIRPSPMALSKRNTVIMHRKWKMEEEPYTGSEYHSSDRDGDQLLINMTAGGSVPTISFTTVEENTIELLVVVTRKMHLILNDRLNEYLLATIGSVAQNFKHSSLKSSIKISIVDIILLDSNFALREGLDDWSNKNHEEVMGKFCHWVNRIRRSTMNWDSAILLNVGNFKTMALGVAHYQAMCSLESSCLVVVDRGFGTADIIAHEIGHQLGAKHDFEVGSECGLEEQPGRKRPMQKLSRRTQEKYDTTIQRDTIMSGILYFELYPFRWSACSRQNIQFFLSRPDSACLRVQNSQYHAFTAEKLNMLTLRSKPGRNFTLNQQCSIALRQKESQFCGHSFPVCKQLHCYDVQRGMCLPVEAPWAEGSRCGYNRWCVMGNCLPEGETIPSVNGGWSAWEEWGACSRFCGGGIQFSRRECTSPEPQNGGEPCLGTNVRIRSCNVQACHEPVDIRQDLCDKVGRQFNKNLQALIPNTGNSNACKLVCLDGMKEVNHNESLPDGTPCYASEPDVCIKGKCWKAGCDKVLGSRMQTDNCNVCGGDNSTCYAVSGNFQHNDALAPGAKPVGLTIAVHIPQGVTNAYIKKVSRRSTAYSADAYDDFMLLIFEELKTRIRRGETREPFAGAELYYSGSRKKEEIVFIKGRINKNVNILIRIENKDTTQPLPDVNYTYYVDKGSKDLRFDPNDYHSSDPLLPFLRSPRKDTPVEEPTADGNALPYAPPVATYQRTQDEPIHFEWKMDEVPKECTSCSGIVKSHASCYPVFRSVAAAKRYGMHPLHPVSARYCGEQSRPAPATRNCADYCGVRWSWKEVNNSDNSVSQPSCSARCGEGVSEVRFTAVCEEKVQERDSSYITWRESSLGAYACIKAELGEPPEDRVITNRCSGSCRPLQWVFSDWHECSEKCGPSTKQRSVTCVDDMGEHWPLTECLKSIPSDSMRTLGGVDNYVGTESDECFEVSGCGGEFKWIISPWSECRQNTVYNDVGALCYSTLRQMLYRKSQTIPSGSSLTGVRSRSAKCILSSGSNEEDQREAPEQYCERAGLPKPSEHQSCTVDFTCYRWTVVHFSKCSTTCSVGQRVGQLSCEEVKISHDESPVVTTLGELDCLYHLGTNVSLLIDSRSDEPTVFIVESGSIEEREGFQRSSSIRPLAYSPGKPVIVACSNPPCLSHNIEWVPSEWSSCSATCGTGFQRRSIRCLKVERQTGVFTKTDTIISEEPEIECSSRGLTRPPDMRLCETAPCVKWVPSEWTECQGTCELGNQERHIRCVRLLSVNTSSPERITWQNFEIPPDGGTMVVEQEVSPSACESQPKPLDKRNCLLPTDCPYWYQGPWSSCSATCGAGQRFRRVDCRFPNGTVLYVNRMVARIRRRRDHQTISRERFHGLKCPEPRPVDSTECQLGPCQENRPFWWPVVSTVCIANGCNRGFQERKLQCLTPSFEEVDPKECAYSRKPLDKIPCTKPECKTYRWRADPWTRCPYTCGKHSRYRNVRCVDDLGGEYADHLCQAHLRPDSWSLCPDVCPDYPISCWDQKQRDPSSTDGIYDMAVHRQIVKIYCSDMETSYPKEYLPLYHQNYASIRHVTEMSDQNCSSSSSAGSLYYNGKVADINETSNSTMQSYQLPDHPSDSVTIFKKLRINLNTLHIDIFDGRFIDEWGQFVPYAIAKSCSRSTCQLGKFLINLEDTGFAVSKETQWRASREKSVGQVVRSENSQIIMGTCGGDCGGCWPDPFLLLDVIDLKSR